jgi:DNA polymerase III sliding clamp (beta) subunit (PCNA family)
MIVDAKEFLSVLRKCQKFVPEQEFAEAILKHFRFQGNTIKAMNRGRGIAHTIEGYDFGDCFVHPDSLIVSFLKLKGKVTLQLEPKNIKITSRSFETRIPTYEINELPVEKDCEFPEIPTDVHDLPKHFLDPVREIYFAAMHDTISFNRISCIFVDKNVFYATNNLVMAKYSSDLDLNGSFTIPDQLVNAVRADKDSPFGYALDGKHFWLFTNNYSAYAKLIENPVPISLFKEAFDSIPKSETFCEFDKSAMTQALKRVEPFSDGTSRKMHVKVTKNKIILECKIDEFGECSEVVDCEGGGDWSFTVTHREFESCTSRIPKFQCFDPLQKQRDALYFKNENLECLLLSLRNEN